MYQTEKDFGKAVMNAFKRLGFTCIRIESASTISGMPDLYVMGYGDDYFIELKNTKRNTPEPGTYKVAWRPGQQGWAATYKLHHTTKDRTKYSWTLQAFNDKVHCIRMDRVFSEDRPAKESIFVVDKPTDIVRVIKEYTYVDRIKEEQFD